LQNRKFVYNWYHWTIKKSKGNFDGFIEMLLFCSHSCYLNLKTLKHSSNFYMFFNGSKNFHSSKLDKFIYYFAWIASKFKKLCFIEPPAPWEQWTVDVARKVRKTDFLIALLKLFLWVWWIYRRICLWNLQKSTHF
jgi:hypothetical protein